ncbi:MAG TPA: PilN domain-containing protein, partial [Xylella taiwanensis]
MARINLLPWRVERRKQRERDFYVMLGFSTLAGVLLAALVWFYYDAQIAGQNDRNAFLVSEIENVKAQNREIDQLDKKKEHLLARKKVIEELQSNRSQMVHLFDSLARTIPDGVVLTSIKQEGNILTLQGRSQSNVRVSTYMRNIEGSGWMTNPDLSIIEAKEQDKNALVDSRALPYVFTIKAKLSKPKSDEVRNRPSSPMPGKA